MILIDCFLHSGVSGPGTEKWVCHILSAAWKNRLLSIKDCTMYKTREQSMRVRRHKLGVMSAVNLIWHWASHSHRVPAWPSAAQWWSFHSTTSGGGKACGWVLSSLAVAYATALCNTSHSQVKVFLLVKYSGWNLRVAPYRDALNWAWTSICTARIFFRI